MRILYISFIAEDIRTGYKDKIYAQAYALNSLGAEVYVLGRKNQSFYTCNVDNDGEFIKDSVKIKYETTGLKKYSSYVFALKSYCKYVENKIRELKPDAIYIRRIRPINNWVIHLIKQAKKLGVIVYYEYPTFPWKPDMVVNKQYISLFIDSIFYNRLLHSIDYLVCMGKCSENRCKVIETMNGIYIKKEINKSFSIHKNAEDIKFLFVGNYSPVHGLDKIVFGLKEYYQTENRLPVKVLLAGPKESFSEVIKLAEIEGVKDKFELCGYLTGEDLEKLYNAADIGIDAIALEIRGEDCICGSLKSREYISKGIPFVCSDMLDIVYHGFEDKTIMYILDHHSKSLDIGSVIEWFKSSAATKEAIINYGVAQLSWNAMMKPVWDSLVEAKGVNFAKN